MKIVLVAEDMEYTGQIYNKASVYDEISGVTGDSLESGYYAKRKILSYYYYQPVTPKEVKSDYLARVTIAGYTIEKQFAITPRAIEVKRLQVQFTYNGSEFSPSYKVIDASTKSELYRDTDYEISGTTKAREKGSYTVTIKGIGNYSGSHDIIWQITASGIDITAPKPRTLTYNGNNQKLITAGTTPVGTLVYRLGEDGTYSENIPTAKDAGNYKVYYKVINATNYEVPDEQFVEVTIQKAEAKFITNPQGLTLYYTGKYQELIDKEAIGKTEHGTIKYKLESGTFTTAPSSIQGKDVGTYKIYYYIEGDENHKNSDEQNITSFIQEQQEADVTITKKPKAKTVMYEGKKKNLLEKGEANNGTFFYKFDGDGDDKYTNNVLQANNAGNYIIEYKLCQNNADNTPNPNGKIVKEGCGYIYPTIKQVTPNPNVVVKTGLVYDGTRKELIQSASATGVGSDKFKILYSMDGVTYNSDVTNIAATNAGIYTIYYKIVEADGYPDNYEDYYGEIESRIDRASSSYSSRPIAVNSTYDGSHKTLINPGTVSCDNCKILYSTDGRYYSQTIPEAVDAGEYTIYYKIAGCINHKNYPEDTDAVVDSIVATISKGAPSVKTINANNRIYDGTVKELVTNVEVEGCKIYYRLDKNDEFSEEVPVAKDARTYKVYYKVFGDKNHTDKEETSIDVTISKRQIEVEWKMIVFTYDGKTHIPIATVKNICGKDDVVLTPKVQGNGASGVAQAGNHKAVVDTSSISGNDKGNYELTESSCNFVINNRTITDVVLDQISFVYDGNPKEPTIFVKDGTNDLFENVDYKVTGTRRETNASAVDYVITIEGINNYSGVVERTWNIEKAAVDVTSNPEGKDLIYNGTSQELIVAGVVDGGTYKYSRSPDSGFDVIIPACKNQGSYNVYYKIEGDANHNSTSVGYIQVTISPVTVDVTWENTELEYNGNEQAPTAKINNLCDDDKDSIELIISGKQTNAGTYTATAALDMTNNTDGNYILPAVVPSTQYVIKPKTLTTDNITVSSLDYEYKKGPISPGIAVKDGEKTLILDVDYYTDGDISGEDVGNYSFTVNGKANYTGSVRYDWTISKANASLTSNLTGQVGLVYDGNNQILVNSGEATGGTIWYKVNDGEYSTSIPVRKDAGSYTITYKVVGDKNHADTVENSFDVTISPKTANLSWSDTSVIYNGHTQKPKATVSNRCVGDDVKVEVTGEATNVGDYTATASNLTGNDASNYVLPDNKTTSYKIIARDITEVILAKSSFENDNTEHELEIKVMAGDIQLTEGDYDKTGDYKRSETGNYTVTITGKGNFANSITKDWFIQAIAIPNRVEGLKYNKTEQPLVSTPDGKTIYYSLDDPDGLYKTDIPTAINAGTYKVYYSGGSSKTEGTPYIEVSISPKEVNVSWSDTSFDYDGGYHVPTASPALGDIYSGDDLSIEVIGQGLNAGSYTATAQKLTGTSAGNYILTGVLTTSFNIDAISLTNDLITKALSVSEATYTSAEITPIVRVADTRINRVLENNITYVVEGDVSKINVGTYKIKITGKRNYKDSVELEWKIVQRTPVITEPTVKTLVYNGIEQTLIEKGSTDMGVIKYKVGEGSYSTTLPKAKDAGKYTISYIVDDEDANDNLVTVEKTLSATSIIEQRSVAIEWSNTEFDYDGSSHIPNARITNLCNDDVVDLTLQGEATNAGTYTAKVVGISGNSNYKLDNESSKTYTIKKRTITEVMLDRLSFTYNGYPQKPTVLTVKAGSMELATGDYSVTVHEEENANSSDSDYYNITIAGRGNFEGSISKQWRINKAVATFMTLPIANSLTYNSQVQELINTGESQDGTIMYRFEDTQYSTDIPKATDAGTYKIYYKIFGNQNHTDSDEQTIDVVINKIIVNVTWDNLSFIYNGEEQVGTPYITNLCDADKGKVTLSYSVLNGTSIDAGTYGLKINSIGGEKGSNYSLKDPPPYWGFEIHRKTLQDARLVEDRFEYTGSFITPTLIVKDGDKTLELNKDYEITSGDIRRYKCGKYEISIRGIGNYVGDISLTWNIVKKRLTFSALPTPKLDLEYNGTMQELINPGIATGGTVKYKVNNGEYSSDIPTMKNQGTYNVFYKIIADDNYELPGEGMIEVTIRPKEVRVIWPEQDPIRYEYDGTVYKPIANVDPSDICLGEELGVYVEGGNSVVGVYTATAEQLTGSYASNYKINPSTATKNFSITAKPLKDVYLDKSSFQYSSRIITPVVTVIDEDRILEEGKDYKISGDVSKMDEGNYTITVTGIGNYTGNISKEWFITKLRVPIANTLVYDGTEQKLLYGEDGRSDLEYSLDGKTYSKNVPLGKNAGTYKVYYRESESVASNTNIFVEAVIETKKIDIEWSNYMHVYDGQSHIISASLNENDICEEDKGKVRLEPLSKDLAQINAGIYSVKVDKLASTPQASNYAINDTNCIAHFRISPKELKEEYVSIDNLKFVYDGDPKSPKLQIVDSDICINGANKTLVENVDYSLSGNCQAIGCSKDYMLTISGKGNYTGQIEITWEIEPSHVSIVTYPSPVAGPLIYSGQPQELINPGLCQNGTILYKTDKTEYSEDIPTGTQAGTYDVYIKVVGDENYQDISESLIPITVIIEPREVTVDWKNLEFEQDGMPHKPTAVITNICGEDLVFVKVTGEQVKAGKYTAMADTLEGRDSKNYILPEPKPSEEFVITVNQQASIPSDDDQKDDDSDGNVSDGNDSSSEVITSESNVEKTTEEVVIDVEEVDNSDEDLNEDSNENLNENLQTQNNKPEEEQQDEEEIVVESKPRRELQNYKRYYEFNSDAGGFLGKLIKNKIKEIHFERNPVLQKNIIEDMFDVADNIFDTISDTLSDLAKSLGFNKSFVRLDTSARRNHIIFMIIMLLLLIALIGLLILFLILRTKYHIEGILLHDTKRFVVEMDKDIPEDNKYRDEEGNFGFNRLKKKGKYTLFFSTEDGLCEIRLKITIERNDSTCQIVADDDYVVQAEPVRRGIKLIIDKK